MRKQMLSERGHRWREEASTGRERDDVYLRGATDLTNTPLEVPAVARMTVHFRTTVATVKTRTAVKAIGVVEAPTAQDCRWALGDQPYWRVCWKARCPAA